MAYAERLGRRALEPHVAGLLAAGAALVFTTGWLLYMTLIFGLGGTPAEQAFFVLFFFLVTPPNTYLVTRVSWRWFVAPHRQLSSCRATAVGVGTAIVAYLTLSMAFFLAILGLQISLGESPYGQAGIPFSLVEVATDAVWISLIGLAFGIVLTGGVPIVLSVGIALLLARWHREHASSERGH